MDAPVLRRDRRPRRLHHVRRLRRDRLRRHDAGRRADRGVVHSRPAGCVLGADHRRGRHPGRARRLGRRAARPRRRVLRPARGGGRRHGLLRHRLEPDDALPRARVVLDRALHPLRDGHAPRGVTGSRAEVPDRGRVRLVDPAVRLCARLRGDRRDRLLGDRRRQCRRRSSPPGRPRDADRRAWLQGLGGAVPHVDAGRLPGCADVRDGVHVGGDEGGRSRPDAPAPRRRLPRAVGPLDGRDRCDRDHLAGRRQSRRTRPAGPQASARLLVGLARRLHADRDRRGQRARCPRAPLLPDPLRRDVDRLVRGRRGARARAAGAGDAREPRRTRAGSGRSSAPRSGSSCSASWACPSPAA